jgi:hypothetical protein
MNCEYSHSCPNRATHTMYTKVGDFNICAEHAKIAETDKDVRYIEPLYKKILDFYKRTAEYCLRGEI